MKTQLITALDFPDANAALNMVKMIGDAGNYYKVGLELFIAEGHKILPTLKDMGKSVFLDLKIHDIPNTAAKAIISCLSYGADMVNLHTQGGLEMMRYTNDHLVDVCAQRNIKKPLLIGVTLLTSLNEDHLSRYQISANSAEEYVLRLAMLAKEAGLDGVVSSARETSAIKSALGAGFITVTPGIRLPENEAGDQKRVVTPKDAAKMGSNYIVVGRPITSAKDPKRVVEQINEDLI